MYPKKTVLEQMTYFARLRGLDKKRAVESSKKWLEKLQVSEYEKRKMDTLSKGNQQKVQLAATLVCDPDLVVLDEPFSGLDPVNSQILKDVIRELISIGKIVIFSSHQMSYVEEFCEEYGKERKILSAENITLDQLEQCCLEKLSDVLEVEGCSRHHVIFRLKDGTTQWDVLNRLQEEKMDVDYYGSYKPSLNDIFVSCVGNVTEETPDAEERSQTK